MTGDVMVIRKQGKGSLVVDEHNRVRDFEACPDYEDYDGSEEPKCNCAPCWSRYGVKKEQ